MPDLINDNLSGSEFEASVRHVARQLYRHANASGSINLEGRERDEIIDTGTELIIVEATQSRKLEKIEHDLKKSIALVRTLRDSAKFSDHNFRILLVTAEDPTADQNAYVRAAKAGCPKEVISFTALFSRLFDARHYIRLRGDHYFGSVRDPADETNYNVPQSQYIPTALSHARDGVSLKAAELAKKVDFGGRHVLYGDYGSGKSMTLRDIYFRVRDNFIQYKSPRCPIYLNLREHIAQTQPDEALYRHAEKIGFSEPHSLIAAWRAGFVTLFLDGFDELTPPQFASSVSTLRQARRFAVELVLRFIEQTPATAAILIAGRESYFDGREEAQAALGYSESDDVYDLAGFSDGDVARFLKAKGSHLPGWLPTRPLLLGYLANAGVLRGDSELLTLDPASGWDKIIQRVCEREVSQVWGVGFEAGDLRLFLEGLATRARKAPGGRGLEDSDLRSVFRAVFGRDADEPANLLTLRLPGLGSVPGRPGAREFIDADFAEAAASGDLCRYIEAPFAEVSPLIGVSVGVGVLGRQMAAARIAGPIQKINIALSQAARSENMAVTSADLISCLLDQEVGYSGPDVNIEDANFEKVTIDPEFDFSSVTLSRCIIDTVELGQSLDARSGEKSIKFRDCIIDRVEGALSHKDVPANVFVGSTTVETFVAYTATNGAVMRTSLPDPVKVLLTILRKLFMQRGTGRQHSALRRGLPVALVKYVDPLIGQVKAKGFAEDVTLDRRPILVPNRAKSSDALDIINGPNTSNHPLIVSARSMGDK